MIVVNFKNYKKGGEALHLSGVIWKYLPEAIVCVGAVDLHTIKFYHSRMNVYAQHVDYIENEKTTGFISSQDLKVNGAKGSLLNHSEHRIDFNLIRKTVEQMKKEKLKVILCAKDLAEAKKFIALKPDAIAFEDRKLIGSGKSITQYRSGDVEKFAKMLKGTRIVPLCGAGVSTASDVRGAFNLGCKGALIASAIADSSEREVEKLLEEISSIQRYH